MNWEAEEPQEEGGGVPRVGALRRRAAARALRALVSLHGCAPSRVLGVSTRILGKTMRGAGEE